MSDSIYLEIHNEIKRCEDLLLQYEEIGPAGRFGHSVISADISRAKDALNSGDVVELIKSLKSLKECK